MYTHIQRGPKALSPTLTDFQLKSPHIPHSHSYQPLCRLLLQPSPLLVRNERPQTGLLLLLHQANASIFTFPFPHPRFAPASRRRKERDKNLLLRTIVARLVVFPHSSPSHGGGGAPPRPLSVHTALSLQLFPSQFSCLSTLLHLTSPHLTSRSPPSLLVLLSSSLPTLPITEAWGVKPSSCPLHARRLGWTQPGRMNPPGHSP